MSISKEKCEALVLEFSSKDSPEEKAKDVGSTAVQIAILTERIKNLTEHLKNNKKDKHSERGMILLVSRRKRLAKYMKRKQPELFATISAKLGLRG